MNTVYPKFLENTPCGEDLFESAPQKKTAESIANLINDNSSSFKLIGLEGNWGSGKSNLIKIIEKNLSVSHHFFIYDTWSHQVDLHRRSFLEELTEDLQNKQVVESKKWSDKLKDLLSKRKETIQKTIPKFSYPVFIVFAVIALLPVAKAFSELIKKDHPNWSILVAGIPVIGALVAWGVAACRDRRYRRIDELFYIYKEKDLHKTVDEVISEKEPSVREFRKWMDDLNADVKMQVVIVFDNMDRLPSEKIKELWSSIHTFFAEQPYSNIWVIVPFDRTHISEAFNKDTLTTDHFINKTFPAIFSVAPIVLSEWKKYFDIKFKESFGDLEVSELNTVKNLFDLYTDIITPRKIIVFINELVSLKLTWIDKIKMKYMALYVLNKSTFQSDPLSAILNSEYASKAKALFRTDDDLSNNIAALVYNVPVEMASQVTLTREILINIRSKNVDRFTELIKHPSFYEILEQVFTKEEIPVEESAWTFDKLETLLDYERKKEIIEEIWSIMVDKQLETPIHEQSFSNAYKVLLRKATNGKRQKLATYILNQLTETESFNGTNYYNALTQMNTYVEEEKLGFDTLKLITKKTVDPEAFIDFLSLAKGDYKKYKISSDPNALQKFILTEWPKRLSNCIHLSFIKKEYDLSEVRKAVEGLISSTMKADDINNIFEIYKGISKDKPLSKRLEDEAINSFVNQVQADSPVYFELLSMRLARTDKFPGYGGLTESILASTDESTADEIAARIEYYADYGNLLQDVVRLKYPLLKLVTNKLTLKSYGVSRLSIENIIPKFFDIATEIEVNEDDLLNRLDAWSSFAIERIKIDTLEQIVPDVKFFEITSKNSNSLSKHTIKVAIEYIQSLDKEKWIEHFKDLKSFTIRLLCVLIENDSITSMPSNSESEFKEAFLNMIKAADPAPLILKRWKILIEGYDKLQIGSLMKDARDTFINDVAITPAKFKLLELYFRMYGQLEERSNDIMRRIINPVKKDDVCLTEIATNRDFYIMLINKGGNDSVEFINFLRTKIENGSEDIDLKSLCDNIDNQLISRIRIESAILYIDGRDDVDVFKIIKNKVEREKSLHFLLDGDFDLNEEEKRAIVKLEITFTFDNEKLTKEFTKQEWVRLP